MPETSYKVWKWIKPTREGTNQQYNVMIGAKAKYSHSNRFELLNELVCLRLGLALRLPIPLGCMLTADDGKMYYGSLHVSVADEELPPITQEDVRIIVQDISLSCGIVLFDAWILNEDRHTENLLYDPKQRVVHLIDHGRAFYHHNDARATFESSRDEVVLDGHCLAQEMTSLGMFDEWHGRIKSIPEDFIRETILQGCAVGLPQSDVEYCTSYLLDRRDRLKTLFAKNYKTAFPKLKPDLFDPFNGMNS